jgi:hypothetical protein
MHRNRHLSSRWVSLGLAALLLSVSTASAAPILVFQHKESGFILRTHQHSNLATCMGLVRRQLDRLEWEAFAAEEQETHNRYGFQQYGVEPGNLWNDAPLLPPIRLERGAR